MDVTAGIQFSGVSYNRDVRIGGSFISGESNPNAILTTSSFEGSNYSLKFANGSGPTGLTGQDIVIQNINPALGGTASPIFTITTANSNNLFGRDPARSHQNEALWVHKFVLGNEGLSNGVTEDGRHIFMGTVPPNSSLHKRGELCININPASGQPWAWVCTVDGTPGTWVALANVP